MGIKKDQGESIADVVARRIREVRGTRGLSQPALAERCLSIGWNFDPTLLSKIEHRHRAVSVDELLTLALALEVSPTSLLTDFEDPDRPIPVGDRKATSIEIWAWLAGQALPGMDARKVKREVPEWARQLLTRLHDPFRSFAEAQREIQRAVAVHAELVAQLSQIKVQIPEEWEGLTPNEIRQLREEEEG